MAANFNIGEIEARCWEIQNSPYLRKEPPKELLKLRLLLGKVDQLSGEDGTALGFNAHGGHGCISVTSNVAPRLCAEFQGACLKGDYAAALKLHDKLMPLHAALFVETSPAPAKYALSLLGRCAETVRLPMVPVAETTRAVVRAAMVHAGLIN